MKLGRLLKNTPLYCVKMGHYDWVNKEPNEQQLGRKTLGRMSRGREDLERKKGRFMSQT